MPCRSAASSIRLDPASGAHDGAIFLPETAVSRLSGPEGLRLGPVPAHHTHAAALIVVLQGALHKAADAAVLQRDIAGRADQIALAQPALGHRIVIVVEAEMHPVELGLVDSARPDHPRRNRAAHL